VSNVHDWLASQSERVIETSCAWVFLQGERALKLKKPVDYGFLDFSTPAGRCGGSIRDADRTRLSLSPAQLGRGVGSAQRSRR